MFDQNNNHKMKNWQGLLLTKQIKGIRQLKDKHRTIPQPSVSHYDKKLIAQEIARAYEHQALTYITCWNDGEYIDDIGIILEIDEYNQTFKLNDPFSTKSYRYENILSVILFV